MAVNDVHFWFDGAQGESKYQGFENWIDVTSWQFGASSPSCSCGSATQSANTGGKVEIHGLTLTKQIDKATPNLMADCCAGKAGQKAKLSIKMPGGDTSQEFMEFVMKDAKVASVNHNGHDEHGTVETVVVVFNSMEMHYTPQDVKGQAGGKVSMGWDLNTNSKTL